MVVSRKWVGVVDPHWRCAPVIEPRRGGPTTSKAAGLLLPLATVLKHRSHLECFDGIFGLSSQTSDYGATLFRFPLRNPNSESEICSEPCTAERVKENLFKSFQSEAGVVLLFLKNITRVSLFQLETSGYAAMPEFLFKVGIEKQQNQESTGMMAKKYSDAVNLTQQTVETAIEVSVRSCIVEDPHHCRTECSWLLVNVIGSNSEEIRQYAANLKVLPWVGVATLLPTHTNRLNFRVVVPSLTRSKLADVSQEITTELAKSKLSLPWSTIDQKATNGQVFCFLPIPESTALPVHINGYFAVTDDRSRIKWPEYDKSSHAHWNKLLLDNLIVPAYTVLMACRAALVKYQKASVSNSVFITDPYAAWPIYSEVKNKLPWRDLVQPVLDLALEIPLLWTPADGGKWLAFRDAYFLPSPSKTKCPESVIELFLKANVPVVGLPLSIAETISICPELKEIYSVREITQSFLRAELKGETLTAVLSDLPTPTLGDLLTYVLSDLIDSTYTDLGGIPLLPLLSGTVCQFERSPGRSTKFVFLPDTLDAVDLLPGIENTIVDLAVLPEIVQKQLTAIAKSGKLQLQIVTPEVICQTLLKKSVSSWCTELVASKMPSAWKWEPGKFGHPPLDWIHKLWQWLCSISSSVPLALSMLSKCQLPIIPQESITDKQVLTLLELPTVKASTLCTFYSRNISELHPPKLLTRILETLGLQVVESSQFLFNHPHIHEVIPTVTPLLVVQRIMSLENPYLCIEKMTNAQKDTLRNFLASLYGEISVPPEYKQTLRSLPIFKAVPESSAQFIVLNHSILPQATPKLPTYPENWLERCSNEPSSAKFMTNLDITALSQELFCTEHLIPFALKMQYSAAILWVLKQDIPLNRDSCLYRVLATSLKIPTKINTTVWKQPTELYDPRNEQFLTLIDSPDEFFPADDYLQSTLLEKLKVLGLNFWESIKHNNVFIKDRAVSVKTCLKQTAIMRSRCILELLLERSSDAEFLETLADVPFLFADCSPPDTCEYPAGMKWYSSDCPCQLYSITEIGLLSRKNAVLVGSVKPLLSSTYGLPHKHLQINIPFYKPNVTDVKQQLRTLVELPNFDTAEVVNDTVMCIYKYLSNPALEFPISDLPIWWYSQRCFIHTNRVILKQPKDLPHLEPYCFFIAQNSELKKFRSLFKKWGVRPELERADAICILRAIKDATRTREVKRLSDRELDIVCILLDWFHKMKHESHGEILVPTETKQLLPPSKCTFDDREWRQNAQLSTGKFTFVHSKIRKELATYFQVQPLSLQVAPSRKLKLKYIQAGPHEKITHRIQHIVKEYATDIDIFKELIQNADDAGATDVSFLIDWRTHPSDTLISDSLKPWQGPALLAYNDATFSDQDFEHICQLAGETKLKDPLKTGRFGVGFCATYHLTDIPSFISRDYFTIFDPHTSYLGDRVSRREPGMRVNLVENQEDLKIYADQFSPYKDVFGCNVFSLPPEGYKGTLFRFPFRSVETAHRSEISQDVYTKERIRRLVNTLQTSASEIPLFLKHVQKLSLFVLESDSSTTSEMKNVFSVEKRNTSTERLELIKSYSPKAPVPEPLCSNIEMCCYQNCNRESASRWILCSAMGTCRSQQLATKDGVTRGLVPLAEVALRVKGIEGYQIPDPLEGHIFCFLPLPICSGLPFHINGFFDIGKDRRSLSATDDETFGSVWNAVLVEDALSQAVLHLLAFLAAKVNLQNHPEKEKFLKLYYSLCEFKDVTGIAHRSMVPAFKQQLQKTHLKLVWSEVGDGQWIAPSEAFLFQGDKEIYCATIKVMILQGFHVVELPSHLQVLLTTMLNTQKRVYKYQRFCEEILIPNISGIPNLLRDEHLLFLLRKCSTHSRKYDWIKPLLGGALCIPCEPTNRLSKPEDLIDCRKSHLANLYRVEDCRFPSRTLQKNSTAMDGLVALGMASYKLRVVDLQDRAKTVNPLALIDMHAAKQRSCHIIEYVTAVYCNIFMNEETPNALNFLRNIPFLPCVKKPAADLPWWSKTPFVSPAQATTYSKKDLVFSVKPVVKLPGIRSPVLLAIGLVTDITVEEVIEHFACLISYFTKTEVSEATREYLSADKVLESIYRYFNMNCPPKEICMRQVGNQKFIWQDNHFLSSSQVVVNWQHDHYPYICRLSSTNSQFTSFFAYMGVKKNATYEMLLQTLKNIHDDHAPSQCISESLLSFVEHVAASVAAFIERGSPSHSTYLPDEHKVMRSTSVLACDKDMEGWVEKLGIYHAHFEEGQGYFVHSSIPTKRAITLGARSVLDAVLKDIEDEEFLSGSDFGQQEDLCDRLNSILRKYPADRSIFQEFIQNADDAQASEIVFILDHRTNFPDQKLFPGEDSWKSLQHTPALCIVNNRKFTENDIRGISRLGRGGKEQSPELIGRFGIGFNVSYHLTDCPSFVSYSELGVPQNFCVFDPTRTFVHNAAKRLPGRRWKVNKDHVKQFSDQFQPYLADELPQIANLAPSCLKQLDETGYVVFRLPLTRCKAKEHLSTVPCPKNKFSKQLGGGVVFGPNEVLKLFDELQQVSKDMLLFLNNVNHISVFEITQKDKYIHHFSTSLSNPAPTTFSQYAKQSGNLLKPLTVFHQVTVNHVEAQPEESASFTTREKSKWLVQRRVGSSRMSPILLQKAVEHSLQPIGGVAAQLGAQKQLCHVFCFLPMNFQSSLPVHVNGHFLVDDSRKHFEKIKHEGLGEWNNSLAVDVIAPAYADFLLEAKKFVESIPDGRDWYYSLFPSPSTAGGIGSLGLVEAVYSELFSRNAHILIREVPLDPELPRMNPELEWLQVTGQDRGHFCVQYLSTQKKKLIEVTTHLRQVLVSLQMLITYAPETIYKSFSTANKEFELDARITPAVVLRHLQKANFKLESTLQVMKRNAEHILCFLIDGFSGKEIKGILQTIPLIVDSNGSLQKSERFFESKFSALLPHCSSAFVNAKLENSDVGKYLREIGVITPLPVGFVAENLCTPPQASSPISFTTTLKKPLELLWKYFVCSCRLGLAGCLKKYFNKFPVIPSDHNQLFPICIAKAVVNMSGDDHDVKQVLKKLGCPFVNLTAVGQDHSMLFDLTNLTTSYSSANDVIQCLELQGCLQYDASLTEKEVLALINLIGRGRIQGIAKKLQKLCLFQRIDHCFVSIDKCAKVLVMPDGVPIEGMDEILKHSTSVVLKAPDTVTRIFYEKVIPRYSSAVITTAEFYRTFVLPLIGKMDDANILKHIVFIGSSDELRKDLLKTPFIRDEGILHTVSVFFDPEVDFFKTFYSKQLLPSPWHAPDVLPILRDLGLKVLIPTDAWVLQAQTFANSVTEVTCPSKSYLKQSSTLLESLVELVKRHCSNVDLKDDTNYSRFLEQVAEIAFIRNFRSPNVCEILTQQFPSVKQEYPTKHFFCFKGSVVHDDANLAGLCRPVLPPECSQLPVMTMKALQIQRPLTVMIVAHNLKKLCQIVFPSCVQKDDHTTKERLTKLKTIFVSHYACLDKMKVDSKSDFIKELSELPCIVMEGCNPFRLVEPRQLVKHIPSGATLKPFRWQVPPYLLQYERLWNTLNIPEELSAIQCASILTDIRTEMKRLHTEISEDDCCLKVATCAYNELIRLLREHETTDLVDPKMLYLLSEQNNLVTANELVYNDVPWYTERLRGKAKGFKFLRQPCPDRSGQRNPPASLQVRLLSTRITEELDADMDTPDVICHVELLYCQNRSRNRCPFVHKVLGTLTSEELCKGLYRIYYHERRESPAEQFRKLVKQLTEVKVTCIGTQIKTVLHVDRVPNPDTMDSSLSCFLASEGGKRELFIAPHRENYHTECFLKELSSAVNKAMKYQVKNEALIAAVFECEPTSISTALDSQRVLPYDPETGAAMDAFHKSGDIVPLNKITREHLVVCVDYVIGETVIYQAIDGQFRYAEVTEVRTIQSISDCSVSIKTVDIKNVDKEVILDIPPLILYKNLTPSQRKSLSAVNSKMSSFVTPVVIASPPCYHFAELQEWIQSVYDKLQGQACVTGLVVSMITMRLIGHLHYSLVVQKMGREHFTPAVLEIQRMISETDLPCCPVHQEHEADLRIALDDLTESIKNMTLESKLDADTDAEDVGCESAEVLTTAVLAHDTTGALATSETSLHRQTNHRNGHLRLPAVRHYRYGYPTSGPHHASQSDAHPAPNISTTGLATSGSSPVQHARFPSHRGRRGQASLAPRRFDRTQELPKKKAPSIPVCLHSAQMWLDQAKADYKAAVFLSQQVGEDECMDVQVVHTRGADEGQSNAFPGLVCFLCHETLEKCLKGVMYAFCGLPRNLLNEGQLVALMQPLQRSEHIPEVLKKPLEECVMQINQHEHKSRLPNYQNPPCAPAVVYTPYDAHDAVSAVKHLLDHLVEDEKLKQLLGDIAQLPKPKFRSTLKSMGEGSGGFPDSWETQGNDGDFQLVVMDPELNAEEYECVENSFLQTMPHVTFIKIERVQNKLLWRKYQHRSELMLQFGGVLHEKLLFHGSRRTKPEEIYKGDAGFDMRFSNDGMWGRGNYFAVNASYSNGYAYVAKGFQKMLAAWVVTGHSYESPPRQYRHPPKRESDGRLGSESAINSRYDSVTGCTGGSRVYITYDNEYAYPAYIITYQP